MAYGASMKLMWQIMERLQGASCEYNDAEIVLDKRVAYLPQVRAAFLREWPGSPNPSTRKATYARVFKSVAHAGGFTRLDRVPLRSYRIGSETSPAIVRIYGQDILLPRESLSPFVELNASPVMEAVEAKTVDDCDTGYIEDRLEALTIVACPVSTMGQLTRPVVRIEG